MPTGNTSIIGEGATFEEFIMRCARGMGACVTMRDDPIDSPIPVFEPSKWNQERLEEEKVKLARLKTMSPEEATVEAKAEYAKTIHDATERIERNLALKAKYQAMLIKVRAWNPPTPDHVGLKDFMVQQITESIDFDCGGTYYEKELKTQPLTGRAWLAKELEETYRDIEYHTTEQAKEEERVAARNKWVKALRDSI